MLRRTASALLLLILSLASLPLQAAEKALDAISSDASVVIRMKNPKATVGKAAELADLVAKSFGDHIRDQTAKMGEAILNPTLAGVDMESDWWVAVYAAGGEEEPDVVFLIPASDMKAMKEALGESVKVMEQGKLAVYTTDAQAASKTAARIKGEGKSISTLIDKESTTVFESGDVSVFINVPQLAAVYKTQIDEAKEKVTETLENAPAGVPGAGPAGIDPKQASEIAAQVFGFLVQGLTDTQSCTIAAVVSKEGLNFEDLVRVKASSPTDKLLAKSAPAPLAGVASLPAGNLVYFGLAWDMSDFTKLSQWIMGAGAAKPQSTKEFDSALKEMEKLKLGSVISAFGLGDADEGAVRSVTVTETDNPPKLRELSQKMMKAMGSVEAQGIKQTFTIKPDAEKYGKNSADVVTVKTEFDGGDNPFIAAMMQRVTSTLFGPDGMTTRVVYLKDRVVQTLGGGKQAMTDVLAAIEKPSETANSPLRDTRAKLGPKANLLFLFDLTNTIAKIMGMIVDSQSVPLPIDPEAVKDLQAKPSYLGLTAGTEPQSLRVRTHVPLAQMQGIAKIVKFVQDTIGNVGGNPAEEAEEN